MAHTYCKTSRTTGTDCIHRNTEVYTQAHDSFDGENGQLVNDHDAVVVAAFLNKKQHDHQSSVPPLAKLRRWSLTPHPCVVV